MYDSMRIHYKEDYVQFSTFLRLTPLALARKSNDISALSCAHVVYVMLNTLPARAERSSLLSMILEFHCGRERV
jgi:hypothetical protein